MQLPDLEDSVDIEIVEENLQAVQAILFAWELERMRLFQVVERIVELFAQGALPIGREVAGRVRRRHAEADGRLDASARAGLYVRVLGAPGGAGDAEPNRAFAGLWLRFLSAVAARDGRPESTAPAPLIADRCVRGTARALAVGASQVGGLVRNAAADLAAQIDGLTAILADPDVLGAFGARDLWQVIDTVNAVSLGGAADADRHRDRAGACRVVLEWLAAHAAALRTAHADPEAAPAGLAASPGDAALVAAAVLWLDRSDGEASGAAAWGRVAHRVDLADERHLRMAYDEAAAGYAEGGCPIGGVLVDNDSGAILGQGRNALVQEGNPVIHGEMAALRAAGRLPNRHRTTMVTTLQPCFMCAGTIVQFGIPRVVIGDVVNAASDETIAFLRGKGVEVVVMDPGTSRAARDCVDLVRRFRAEKPELWLEDWGGGVNPALRAPRT